MLLVNFYGVVNSVKGTEECESKLRAEGKRLKRTAVITVSLNDNEFPEIEHSISNEPNTLQSEVPL